MQFAFTYAKKVPFSDTDMAGIVHFSRILCYVEEAEHAALSSVNVPVISAEGGFPKVHVQCDYRSPVRFDDTVEIAMVLQKVGERSLRWKFLLTVAGELCAEGQIVTVSLARNGEPFMLSDEVRAKLLKLSTPS